MSNVALVGADPDERALLRGLLHLGHHRVVVEGDAPEVIGQLEEPPGLDILVVDTDVSGAQWTDVVDRATEHHPNLKVVLVTKESGSVINATAKRAGVVSVLRRPFLLREFTDAIDPALSRSGAYWSPPADDPPSSAP